MTLGLVAVLTAVLFALVWEIGLAHGSVVYLIPVVIAATRWGIVSAVVAADLRRARLGLFLLPAGSTASASRIRRKSST